MTYQTILAVMRQMNVMFGLALAVARSKREHPELWVGASK